MIQTTDWIIIALYFLLLAGMTWYLTKKNKDTADDYFLAGRNLGWFIVGASIFASNIGSEHVVGLAGSGFTDGVAMAHYELHAWCLLVLGWVMVPFYMRSKVFTMPEFLEKRFSPNARWLLSMISLVAYVLTKIAVGIYAGGVVFGALLPDLKIGSLAIDSFWVGSIAVVILTGIYTIIGGLRAVAYTEAVQTVILVVGSVLVTLFGLKALGGIDAPGISGFFKDLLAGAGELKRICGSEMFNLWKPLVPAGVEGTWAPVRQTIQEIGANGAVMTKTVKEAWYFNSNYPWLGMLFCAPIIGLWYWCTDQYIVQRALGAASEKQARRGSICASYFKLLPVFIFIIPGLISFALLNSKTLTADSQIKADRLHQVMYQTENSGTEAAPVDPLEEKTKSADESTQKAFPALVASVLPIGIRGIVVAGLLAALMSSLAGAFNASSTLFTIDFYSKFKPKATQHDLVWIGRVATAVMVLIGLAWIPVIRGGKGLYDYLQGVQSYLAPPIFVVFFLGVFNKRLNSKGCLSALIVGFILGLFRLIIDTPVKLKGVQYAEGSFFWVLNNIYFQYFSIIILVVCILVMFIVSYLTKAPKYAQISGLTYGTVTHEHKKESRATWGKTDVFFSVLIVLIIVAIYLTFTG